MFKNIPLFVLVIVSLFIISCSKDGDDPNNPGPGTSDGQAELTTQLTESPWEVATVTRENSDVSSDYNGFRLNFRADGSYSTENGSPAWNPSGTWEYPNAQTTNQILVDGVILMDLVVNGNNLTLSFAIEEDVFSRTKTVSADYEFSLSK